MDPRLKEIADNFDKKKIGLDDTFKFHCTECGKCCTEREDILLTARDVYNVSRELGMEPLEMVQTYCESYIGQDSRIPLIRIKPRGTIRRCPLMKDRKCSVHKAKPLVCAMFPLGRVAAYRKNEFGIGTLREAGIQYIYTKPNCGDDTETFTVREYLESFGIPVDDDYFYSWHELLAETSMFLNREGKNLDRELLEKLWLTILMGIYLKYDTAKPFTEQFEANKKQILEIIRVLRDGKNGRVSA